MRRDAAAAAAMEGLQERILDLNDKLRHATLPLSAGRGAPAGRGCVIPKGRRGRGDRCSAVVAGARSLHAIRAALEDLEGHLHCLRDVIVQQQVKRGAAISRLQQSRYHAQYITRSYGDRGNIVCNIFSSKNTKYVFLQNLQLTKFICLIHRSLSKKILLERKEHVKQHLIHK
ncbi:uncharacterized protein LOC133919026 isoform X1 [Phragmites australis]|uniref:uncharacterized protein LOC133919026 isoform X1 n=1 Tax=Phragmites australis TaxID=29695 RepID=UPI002D7712EF|nr:uncharacterized protein LOC133919026 isoform X1 [Phragmites australis]